jgi:hypothetical protein
MRRVLTLVVSAVLALAACNRTEPPAGPRPDHLVVMVFDQMRPDYIDRFDLKHFKRLRAASRALSGGVRRPSGVGRRSSVIW